MTISRGQMKRQLYEGGGIMSLSKEGIGGGIIKGVDMGSRIGFFNPFKAAKKAVKKVTKGVKGILSSDLGKAALLYGATAGLGALGAGKGFGSLMRLGTYAPGSVFNNLGASATNLFKGRALGVDKFDNIIRGQSGLDKVLGTVTGGGIKGNIGKLATLTAVSGFLTKTLGMTPEQAEEELSRDPSTYLRQYYTNLNPNASEEEISTFVAANTSEYAVGGRVGFAGGGDGYKDYLQDLKDGVISPDTTFNEWLDNNAPDPDYDKSYAQGGRIGFAEGTYKDFEEFMMRRSESMSERQKEELRKQFEMYMRSKDPTVEAAEGGRIGFAEGPVLPPDPTQPVNPFAPKPTGPVLPDKMMASNMENDKILEALFEKYLDMGLSPKDAAEAAQEEFDRMGKMRMDPTIRGAAALGGRMNYSAGSSEISINKIEMLIKKGADNDLIKEYTGAEDGVIDQIRDAMERKNKAVGGKMDSASDNAMQAAGIEGLPIRQNPKGVKELDLRNTGGFIQPVGIKEKEDDIPAMLSNNEFVFTADAVRGMGDGNVNVGAQRMYDMMKKLEAGGRV